MSTSPVIHDYIAGALAGAAGLVVGHPFDTTKVQMQVGQVTSSPYRGMQHAMSTINKQGWVRGFFRGLGFPLASYSIVNSVFFGVYGNTLTWCRGGEQRGVRYSEVFVAGCVGGFAQLLVACPVDLVKVVLQSQIDRSSGPPGGPSRGPVGGPAGGPYYRGPVQCFLSVYRQRGVRGLYHGLGIMAARDIPASATYFLVYEWTSRQMTSRRLGDGRGVVASLVAGGLAGVVSWALVLPLDVVKSLVQEDYTGGRYRSAWQCARAVYARAGLGGFTAGLQACVLRACVVNAVIFAAHKEAMALLDST